MAARACPRRVALLLLGLLAAAGGLSAVGPAHAEDEGPAARLEADVRHLASPALAGRGDRASRHAAAAWIADRFEALGLQPAPGLDGMWWVDQGPTKPAPEGRPAAWDEDARIARNVAGWLPLGGAAEDDAPPRYVMLTAHYDHLGTSPAGEEGEAPTLYPGADDNASGVAALLEVARRLRAVRWEAPPPRGVLFVAFDLEEQGLVGSRRWAAEAPVPLEGCDAFLTMDQMGRSLADLTPGSLFLMGSEHSALLAEAVASVEAPAGVTKAVLGIDFQPPTGYSDYVAFQEREIPFLFVSSGACADYHQPTDLPERIDAQMLAARTRLVEDLVTSLVVRREAPAWREPPPPDVAEIATLRDLVKQAEERLPGLGVPEAMVGMVAGYRANLDRLVAKGEVSEAERRSVRVAAHMLFQQAVQLAGQAGGGR